MRRKNLSKILLVLALGIALLIPGLASANSVYLPDTTLVQAYRGAGVSNYPGWTGWFDIIGDDTSPGSKWNLVGVSVTWTPTTVQMGIYTNYPQAGYENGGVADIALDRGSTGTFSTGIKMSGTNMGTIYSVPGNGWITAITQWTDGGAYIYGGRYDQSDPKISLTTIDVTKATAVGPASVNWTEINGISKYLINVEFPLVDGGGNWNKFSFEVANGTCSNDGQGGSVGFQFGSPTPLPSTLLLLGGGLLALTLLGRRRGTYNRSRND